MNNLEYIRSLEVEKLVEFITDCTDSCYVKGYFGDGCDECPLYGKGIPNYGSGCCTAEGVVKWLLEERRTDEEDTDSVHENL